MNIHLWHTSRLRTELATDSLQERDASSYMVVAAALYAYTFYAASWFGGYRHWSVLLEAAAVCVIGVFGTLECYRANGGSAGKQFLSRFSALCVPVGVKLALLNVGIALFMYYGFPQIVTPASFRHPEFVWRFTSFVLNLAVSFLFYARLVHHISLVNKLSRAPVAHAA